MIKKFADKTPIVFSFVATIAILAVVSIAQFGFAALFGVDMTNPVYDVNFFTASIITKIVFSVAVMLILIALKMSDVNNPLQKGFFKGLGLGWFWLIGILLNFVLFFDFSRANTIEQSKWLLLVPIFIETLLAGVSEELMCRGVLYNVINNKYKNVHAAVLLSSAVFGVVHFVNLVNQSFVDTVLQVLFAFGGGVFFAAVYARCKTVWVGVVLHGLTNFADYAAKVLTPSKIVNENLITILMTVYTVALLCVGLFLIRKKKMAEIAG